MKFAFIESGGQFALVYTHEQKSHSKKLVFKSCIMLSHIVDGFYSQLGPQQKRKGKPAYSDNRVLGRKYGSHSPSEMNVVIRVL